ncbi:MAG: cytochrome c [Betaproteobacteria bacterium]|nr:cytochrome c [Betaproteobacteria bacterium]
MIKFMLPLILVLPVLGHAQQGDTARGQAMYELHCGGCHSESVHGRPNRTSRNIQEVQSWVVRWSTHLRANWRAEDVADVTRYLNDTYYGFPCEGC